MVPLLCFRHVYTYFLREFSFNQLPAWVDVKQKKVQGNNLKLPEEKCFDEEAKSVNETTVEEHPDCYEKINETAQIFSHLHLWLDGLLVPFTGKHLHNNKANIST